MYELEIQEGLVVFRPFFQLVQLLLTLVAGLPKGVRLEPKGDSRYEQGSTQLAVSVYDTDTLQIRAALSRAGEKRVFSGRIHLPAGWDVNYFSRGLRPYIGHLTANKPIINPIDISLLVKNAPTPAPPEVPTVVEEVLPEDPLDEIVEPTMPVSVTPLEIPEVGPPISEELEEEVIVAVEQTVAVTEPEPVPPSAEEVVPEITQVEMPAEKPLAAKPPTPKTEVVVPELPFRALRPKKLAKPTVVPQPLPDPASGRLSPTEKLALAAEGRPVPKSEPESRPQAPAKPAVATTVDVQMWFGEAGYFECVKPVAMVLIRETTRSGIFKLGVEPFPKPCEDGRQNVLIRGRSDFYAVLEFKLRVGGKLVLFLTKLRLKGNCDLFYDQLHRAVDRVNRYLN